jgi:hypothetical protein
VAIARFSQTGAGTSANTTLLSVPLSNLGTMPANTYLIMALTKSNSSQPSLPGGWTRTREASAGTTTTPSGHITTIYTRFATGALSNVTITWTNAAACAVAVGAWTGVDTTTPLVDAAYTIVSANTTTTVDTPSVNNTQGTGSWGITACANSPAATTATVTTYTAPTNYTEVQDQAGATGAAGATVSRCSVELAERSAAPAGSQSASATRSNTLSSFEAGWLGFLKEAAAVPHLTKPIVLNAAALELATLL